MRHEREKFMVYENIRRSGVTNMFAITTVCELSNGELSKNDCLYIMKHYEELSQKYLTGGKDGQH